MPVNTLPAYILRPAEIATVAKEISSVVKNSPSDEKLVHSLANEIMTLLIGLEEQTGDILENNQTQELLEADELRDELHQKLVKFIRGARFHPDQQYADAATMIYNLLESCNLRLNKESYSVESHHLNALLFDLQKDIYVSAAEKLGISDLINDVRNAQTHFERIHLEKNKSLSETIQFNHASLILPIRKALNDLLSLLGTLERLNPKQYSVLVIKINGLIDEFAAKARARKTRAANEKEELQKNQ